MPQETEAPRRGLLNFVQPGPEFSQTRAKRTFRPASHKTCSPNRQMARPLEFDPSSALESALDVFWRQGFRRPSLTDLSAAMRLSRSSVYQSFGSKRELLEAAIDRYAERQAARVVELGRKRPLRVALQMLFKAIAHDNNGGQGCLLGNCAVELGPHDPRIAERVQRGFAAQTAVFERMIRGAQRRGEIDRGRSPKELAYYVATTITGMRVLAKTGLPSGLLLGIGDTALQNLLGAPVRGARGHAAAPRDGACSTRSNLPGVKHETRRTSASRARHR